MSASVVHVAVGVVRNPQGDILIAKRPSHVHQGGLWEFPGGKVKAGESPQLALQRELHEELDIDITRCRPLIRIPHHYPDKQVLLDVWLVEAFNGIPHGKENQPIQWHSASELWELSFPAANHPIIQAINLPDRYLITGNFADKSDFLHKLDVALKRGVKLVQLRAKRMKNDAFIALAETACAVCHEHGARLLLNASPAVVVEIGADGVHLTSERLMALSSRPLGLSKLVAASVHNQDQLAQAERLKVDFSVISPILPTPSHLDAWTLGWHGFQQLTEQATHPAYALGGMQAEHLADVWRYGGQGIAAIHSLWG
ncbi:MAG: Nudix family hydrolase [Halobacteria archaeon]|nr:Nudix family hydrolase [Halobacteria archaeon]